MFPHRNIRKYTCTSTDGKTYNQFDHILTDRRWNVSILDVRSFRGGECVTGGCKREGKLAVRKQVAQEFDVEIFNLRNLSELKVRKQYQIKI
jgi:hypothetical protein